MEEDKDAIIRQQRAIIKDQEATNAELHLAFTRYKDFYWHAEREPWGYFFWLIFGNIWPFSGIWKKS